MNRVLPARPDRALVIVLAFTALLYAVELVDVLTPTDLDQAGIVPRDPAGLTGVLAAPLLHASWSHLLANTLPVLVLGFLVQAERAWPLITAVIWLVSGLGVWLTGAPGVTVGASGLCFGWLVFLLVRGLFTRAFGQLVLGGALLLYWGTMLLGVLPGTPRVSWQAHLFGAVAGACCAWWVGRARPAGTLAA